MKKARINEINTITGSTRIFQMGIGGRSGGGGGGGAVSASGKLLKPPGKLSE
jgi:hypothetical protein